MKRMLPTLLIVTLAAVFLAGWAIPTQSSEEGGVIATIFNIVGIIVWTFIGVFVYFVPSIIAYSRRVNVMAIFMLNLLLGWTFVGWAVAFVWSLTDTRDRGWGPPPASTSDGSRAPERTDQ